MTIVYGITPSGFVTKPFSVIRAENQDELKSIFGSTVNLLPEGVFGQLVDVYADREAAIWELLEAAYNSGYLTASGASLDYVAGITGKVRLPASKAVLKDVEFTFTGAATVSAGDTFSDPNDATKTFEIEADLVASGASTLTSDLVAVTAGAVSVNIDTITNIDNPVAGLASVTNPGTAVGGRDIETDAELRARLQALPTISVNNTADSIENAVRQLNLDETETTQIESVFVIENTSDVTDGDGRPSRSIEVVVYTEGESDRDDEIATAIATSKTQGMELVSTTGAPITKTVTMEGGNTRSVTFSNPTEVDIYTEVVLTVNTDFPVDGLTQVESAIDVYISGLTVGDNVIVYGSASIATAISSVAGIVDYEIKVGTAASPTLSDNIVIGLTQIAIPNTTDVTEAP